jgi:tRNA/tmRNA/rRNA uracil-C5-methylase (TrmA/RlmC/RlmD family)
LLGDLVAHVTERVPVGGTVLDLYAGVGLFAVAAAVIRGASVVAVEGDAYAADDLHANAAAAGGQVTTVRGAVEGIAAGMFWRVGPAAGRPRPRQSSSIRRGPACRARRWTKSLTLTTPRLIYVSCDCRDARARRPPPRRRRLRIERIDGFDLFPNTPHVETVVVFTARRPRHR